MRSENKTLPNESNSHLTPSGEIQTQTKKIKLRFNYPNKCICFCSFLFICNSAFSVLCLLSSSTCVTFCIVFYTFGMVKKRDKLTYQIGFESNVYM